MNLRTITLAWLLWAAAAGAAPVRLAVIPEEKRFQPAGDLLTTLFSTNDQVVLMEQVELEKVLREQELAATSQP